MCFAVAQPAFALLDFIDVNRQAVPLDDASLPIAQRLTTSMVPTKLAVRPAQTHHTLVRSAGPDCVIESLLGFRKVGRGHERLPAKLLKILKPHATVVRNAPIEMGRLAVGPVRPDEAWYCFDDLAEL